MRRALPEYWGKRAPWLWSRRLRPDAVRHEAKALVGAARMLASEGRQITDLVTGPQPKITVDQRFLTTGHFAANNYVAFGKYVVAHQNDHRGWRPREHHGSLRPGAIEARVACNLHQIETLARLGVEYKDRPRRLAV